MKESPLITQLLGETSYSVPELQQQLDPYRDNDIINTDDIHQVLELLSGDSKHPGYAFQVHDMAGVFEHQAYLLQKGYAAGEWRHGHINIFKILAHCARLEPRLFEKGLVFERLLQEISL